MSAAQLKERFSSFIQRVKEKPEINHTFLPLQSANTDTIMTLFLAWYGLSGYGRVYKKDLERLKRACESWHEGVVKALSRLASTIGQHKLGEGLPRDAQNLSAFALQAELDMLEQTLTLKVKSHRSNKQRLADCCHNIVKHISARQLPFGNSEQKKIITLLGVCFPKEQRIIISQHLLNASHHAKVKSDVFLQLSLDDED